MNPEMEAATGAAPSIQLAVKWETAALGGELVIGVKHLNNRSNQRLVLRDPEKDRAIRLAVQRPGGLLEAGFGRVFHKAFEGNERIVVEDAQDISLEPGAAHVWSQDVGHRWPELFAPGDNILVIRDYVHGASDKPNLSNSCRVRVQFDAATTFPRLMEILSAPESSIDSKDWAAGWIQRIQPDFVYISDPEPPGLTRNAAAVAAARQWWNVHHHDPTVRRGIDAINREARVAAPPKEN